MRCDNVRIRHHIGIEFIRRHRDRLSPFAHNVASALVGTKTDRDPQNDDFDTGRRSAEALAVTSRYFQLEKDSRQKVYDLFKSLLRQVRNRGLSNHRDIERPKVTGSTRLNLVQVLDLWTFPKIGLCLGRRKPKRQIYCDLQMEGFQVCCINRFCKYFLFYALTRL